MSNKLVIFDLDNTLVITRPAAKEAYKQAIRHIAHQHGMGKLTNKLYAHWKRVVQKLRTEDDPVKRQFRYSLSLLLDAQKIPDTYLHSALQVYEKVLHSNLEIQRGVKELFQWLKKNQFSIAVATESLRSDAKKKLRSVGLFNQIDYLITSNDVGTMKPNLAYYQLIVERSGIPKKAIYVVGDKLAEDIMPAQQLGLKTFQVPPDNFHLGIVQSQLKSAML